MLVRTLAGAGVCAGLGAWGHPRGEQGPLCSQLQVAPVPAGTAL